MIEILSLGIYRNNKGIYEVIGYINATMKFFKFELNSIFNKNRRAWDIGAITKVESFIKMSDDNIKIIGDCSLDRYLDKHSLKEFLEKNKIDFMKCIKTYSIKFCIIKPSIIQKIYMQQNRCYVELISEGICKKLQIKDVRWIEYWNYILKKNDKRLLEEKESHYKKFLNEREVFFLGYKENIDFNNRNQNSRYKIDTSYINIASVFWF